MVDSMEKRIYVSVNAPRDPSLPEPHECTDIQWSAPELPAKKAKKMAKHSSRLSLEHFSSPNHQDNSQRDHPPEITAQKSRS